MFKKNTSAKRDVIINLFARSAFLLFMILLVNFHSEQRGEGILNNVFTLRFALVFLNINFH